MTEPPVIGEITFPAELPVSQRRDDIAAAIRDHQVVVVAGETGSGKTTQLPKICLQLGRRRIAHTQPRRIAARSVAERIAAELGTELGDIIGYTVRFTDRSSRATAVRLMTDGILLAAIHDDPLLRRYDTIIVDEAHERSLNIDFLLGYLHQLLPRRPELKLIITSATIDSERFAAHFAAADSTPAPIIEVSGRTYPVAIRYRPVVDPDDPAADPDRDQVAAVVDAVAELQREGPGDILVFCSGEREIRDAADAIGEAVGAGRLAATEIVPLFARLSAAEQHRVFAAHRGRRVVLATNVAETSLTVPGIHYVIDPGFARISRYSVRTKVQRLPIEPVSQASARQRAGRCGRVADGICIRLYSEQDFDSRPEFTDPEILRTNLASVILAMTAVGLGDIAGLGFIDPPDPRRITDGLALLLELNAIEDGAAPPSRTVGTRSRRSRSRSGAGRDGRGRAANTGRRLTGTGRRLVQLPVDPRLARMVLAADALGCVEEVIVIAAALSIQDPRERPEPTREQADALHRRFTDASSDFIGYLNLWQYLREQQEVLSSSAFRRMCRREYLHFLRVREWQDLVAQLRRAAREAGVTIHRAKPVVSQRVPPAPDATPGELPRPQVDADRVHQALLTGLLSHVGARDDRLRQGQPGQSAQPGQSGARRRTAEYLGARGVRFAIWPGSALARRPPELVVAAEIVETARTWARTVAGVDPAWVETAAAHVVKRQYSEPHWSANRASVVAVEKVSLYGVTIVADRRIQYGRIDPVLSRELFIRHALVQGEWRSRHHFLRDNRMMLERVAELEHRSRRRDIVVDDETLVAFYDQRIPADVVSGAHFDTWWRKARHVTPTLLTFTEDDLLTESAEPVDRQEFPDHWQVGDLNLEIGYRFDPGAGEDGVTVSVPAAVLTQLGADAFEWQVPGLRHELVTALIRSLPKHYRRHLAPAPDNADKALQRLTPHSEPLLVGLSRELSRLAGVSIPADAFDWEKVPGHLRVRVAVTGDRGATVAAGKDVAAVSKASRHSVEQALDAAATDLGLDARGLASWTIGDLPRTVEIVAVGGTVTGYPALVDVHGDVHVKVLASAAEQARAMRAGTRRLLLSQLPVPSIGSLTDGWDSPARLALTRAPHPSMPALVHDVAGAVVDDLVAARGGPVWQEAQARELVTACRQRAPEGIRAALPLVARVLASARSVDAAVRQSDSADVLSGLVDAREHLAALIHPGFVTEAGLGRLPDLQRYLQSALRRLQRLTSAPNRDAAALAQVVAVRQRWRQALADSDPADPRRDQLAEIRWSIEELRVSLLAPGMPTSGPVSVERIDRRLRELTG